MALVEHHDLRSSLPFDELSRAVREEMVRQESLVPEIERKLRQYLNRGNDRATLRDLQAERLATLLTHATSRVPAYRDLEPMWTDSVGPFEALRQFPLVDKKALRARLLDHCDDDIDPSRCRYTITSGTSGEPLKIIHDIGHAVHTYALTLARTFQYGLPLNRTVLRPYELWLQSWFEYTSPAYGFARIAEFGEPDGPTSPHMLARVRKFRPDVVRAHPSRLLRLARALDGDGNPPIRPMAVLCYGERLDIAVRQSLGQLFQAPVFDLYGMRELFTIAAQCRQGSYHIESERLWVEIIDENGDNVPDGTTGEIVVTNLMNTAMPFIRYRTGDIGALNKRPCTCGQPHKVLSLIEGREPGIVILPDGSEIEALRLVRLMRALRVERFQIQQRDLHTLTILVKPMSSFGKDEATHLIQRAMETLRGQMKVQVLHVDDGGFTTLGSGKAVDFVNMVERSAK